MILKEVKAFQKRERQKRRVARAIAELSEAGACMKARRALQRIARLVSVFERACNKAEYTDTGATWEVFYRIREIARGEA